MSAEVVGHYLILILFCKFPSLLYFALMFSSKHQSDLTLFSFQEYRKLARCSQKDKRFFWTWNQVPVIGLPKCTISETFGSLVPRKLSSGDNSLSITFLKANSSLEWLGETCKLECTTTACVWEWVNAVNISNIFGIYLGKQEDLVAIQEHYGLLIF